MRIEEELPQDPGSPDMGFVVHADPKDGVSGNHFRAPKARAWTDRGQVRTESFAPGPTPAGSPKSGWGVGALGTSFLGYGWLFGGGGGDSDAVLDPHSTRTIRLVLLMCVFGVALAVVALTLLCSVYKTSKVHRAVNQGHADARAYRASQARKSKKLA